MSLPQGFFALQAELVGDVQVASHSQECVSVVSQGVNSMVKEMYHLCPKVSTSCVSYRDTVRHLTVASLEHIGKLTCNAARDTRMCAHTHIHKYGNTTQHIHFAPLDNMEGTYSLGDDTPHTHQND